jgi:hypothetical protein
MKDGTIFEGLLDRGVDHPRVSRTDCVHAALTRLPVASLHVPQLGTGIVRTKCLSSLWHFGEAFRRTTGKSPPV